MMRLRWVIPFVIAPLLVLTPAHAKPYPSIVPLPDDFQPEGIATAGHTFYTGSLWDGDIYRGDLRTGRGEVFIDVSGRQAVGMKVDRRHGLLWVAGGFDGRGYVYDLRTGAEVANLAMAGLINDVVVTPRAAYFTNTFAPEIFRVPIGEDGSVGEPESITVTGPAAAPITGFGLNGIDSVGNGASLVVCHSDFGKLYTIDPATGASSEIVLPDGSLVAGTPDGILRQGRTIWVVENFADRVSKVRVSPDWSSGSVVASVTHPAFQVPATVARHGDRLAVVNAKFDLGFPPPLGPGAPPGTPFEVVQFRAP